MKDVEVYLLQVAKPDWKTYIKVCTDNLEFSPTRGLDSNGMSIEQFPAFVATLDFNNRPNDALKVYAYYRHTFFSFLAVGDDTLEHRIRRLEAAVITRYNGDKCVAVISGTLAEFWLDLITGLKSTSTKDMRQLLNKIYIIIERLGYGKIFEDYDTVSMPDGTFSLRYK